MEIAAEKLRAFVELLITQIKQLDRELTAQKELLNSIETDYKIPNLKSRLNEIMRSPAVEEALKSRWDNPLSNMLTHADQTVAQESLIEALRHIGTKKPIN